MESFGDKLYRRVSAAKLKIFVQGELAQLTTFSYEKYLQLILEHPDEKINFQLPVAYDVINKTVKHHMRSYSKDELQGLYSHLGLNILPLNGIYQLVTILEALFCDILKEVLKEYPSKIKNKGKKIDVETIIDASSLEEIRDLLVNSIINELAYKSPREFAEEFAKYVGVDLLENVYFNNYIEIKAARDIHIHNSGVINDTYIRKVGNFARGKSGDYLSITVPYFLEAYESCLQITEALDSGLNKIWSSEEYKKATVKKPAQQKTKNVTTKKTKK